MVLFNFAGKKEGPPTSPSVRTTPHSHHQLFLNGSQVARETLHILSSHYPENLALSYFMNLSWLVRTFVNLMWPFVDPVTKQKVRFCTPEELGSKGDIDRNVLLKECGGDLDVSEALRAQRLTYQLPYDHDTYWPTLIETCIARREEHIQAWRSLGPPEIGRSERDFKKSPSLQAPAQ